MKDGRKIGINLHDLHVRNCNISKLTITCTFQVNRIVSLFRLHPATVYLSNVKEHNEMAIFPGPSGSFSSSQVESGSTYEVVGDPSPGSIQTGAHPFGAFTTLSTGIPPPPIHPPTFVAAAAQKGFRKTIILVTLSLSPTSSKSTKSTMSYTIVTQTQFLTQVLVNCNCSKPSAVTRMVSSNVGYDVILLDSKCYSLLDNSVTTSIDFWKSTLKFWQLRNLHMKRLLGRSSKELILISHLKMCIKHQ